MNRREFFQSTLGTLSTAALRPKQLLNLQDAELRGVAGSQTGDTSWWYREPARVFWEGLPIATGRLAAMVYGRVRDELILFNDETIWSGGPYNPNPPGALAVIRRIQQLLLNRHNKEAEALSWEIMGNPMALQSYQPAGQIELHFAGHDAVSEYKRELDMESAIVRVSYRIGNIRYSREIFASYPDQLIAIRLTADQPGQVTLRSRLNSIQTSAKSHPELEALLVMDGTTEPTATFWLNGDPLSRVLPSEIRWQARLQVLAQGGSVKSTRAVAADDPLLRGFHLVARDNCGIKGREPHRTAGADQLYPVTVGWKPAVRSIAHGESVQFVYRGLVRSSAYKLRVTFLSDNANRIQRILAGGIVAHSDVLLPASKPVTVIADVPTEAYRSRELIVDVLPVGNEKDAVTSVIELWSTSPDLDRYTKSASDTPQADDEDTASSIDVVGADAVTLLLATATNYNRWNDIEGDQARRCQAYMKAVRPYQELKARHLADYQTIFSRCQLYLGRTAAADQDTTTRLINLRNGVEDHDPMFAAQYFQYGRYLLLQDSRAGTFPFNNHNMWLDNMRGRWAGRFTLNINLEMCYWPAEHCNLPEAHEALFEFVQQLSEAGSRTAREMFECSGWVTNLGTDCWMNTAPQEVLTAGIWWTGGVWLLQQLWEHYLFDPDREYLKRLYPMMKSSAAFFADFLIRDPQTGWLVTCPSLSPENSFYTSDQHKTAITMGPTLDNALLRDLFDHCCEAASTLGLDSEFGGKLAQIRRQLPPLQISSDGCIQEWIYDYREAEPTHRHLSPLYPFYPSDQITIRRDPELTKVVRATLERRGDMNLGWSGSWKVNIWARLLQAERAYSILRRMMTEISIHPGPEDSDRVPSMEGNQGIQGWTAGVAEVLIQSHAGEIHLLPALPNAWPTGYARGLRARSGFEVDIEWTDGTLSRAAVRSKHGRPCAIRSSIPVVIKQGQGTVVIARPEATLVRFDTRAGLSYELTPQQD